MFRGIFQREHLRREDVSRATSPRLFVLGSLVFSSVACAPVAMPSAADTARTYARALERNDTTALYEMLSEEGRLHLDKKEVASLLRRNKKELRSNAKSLSGELTVEGKATLFLAHGRRAELQLSEGQFWVRTAGLVPAATRSPEEAVAVLRRAVRARDFERFLSVLTPEAREQFQDAFRVLDESLEELDRARVLVRGDQAVVELPAGEKVKLRLREGSWAVEEIE